MSLYFHKNKSLYFEHQHSNASKYVIPFIEETIPMRAGVRVMEIGCAEGGVLKAFADKGCHCTGVELVQSRVELAREFLKEDIKSGKVTLFEKNIYDIDADKELNGKFDLIVMKDVIEHIHDQQKLLDQLHAFLNPGGHIFFGFPPWYMPFGGHQQICKSKIGSKLPYYHLLPGFLYPAMLRLFGEDKQTVAVLLEIKETGISIERFERIVKQTGYTVSRRTLYLVNPIYELKFGWKPRLQARWMASMPFIRNFFTTCGYYLVSENDR